MSLFSSIASIALPVGVSKIKITIIAILLGSLLTSGLGLYFYVKNLKKEIVTLQSQVNSLSANNNILISNNSTLKNNLDVAITSNDNNVTTIETLLRERLQSKEAVEKLAKTELISKKKIKDLTNEVIKLKGDPTQDGPLAPVLKDTLNNVQNLE